MSDKDGLLGGLASIALHVTVLALLFITIPIFSQSHAPDSIRVELVHPQTPSPLSPKSHNESEETTAGLKAFEKATTEEKANNVEPIMPHVTKQQDRLEPVESYSENQNETMSSNEPILGIEKSSASASSFSKQEAKLSRAKRIYSKETLSNPRVKQALGKLSPKERVIQICGIEALEQIRHQRPDVIPDMMARNGGALTDESLRMHGGAFRSNSGWHNLDFDCKINSNTMLVTSFRYAIGDLIPKKDWQKRELPTD